MDEDIKKQIIETIETHKKMTAEFQESGIETVAAISQAIIRSLEQNGTVYLCGNGGSAADAQHIAGEFVGRFKRERKALPAVALSTDTSVITCIANDYSYEKVFSRQVEALVREGDILWAFSTSGTSANVIAAAESAKNKGACVIAFTGRINSKLEQIADICFCAEDESTARSQEIHQLAYHIICDLVECRFTKS
ncbi:MAG: SIS domain-containing protein [Planctomycetes bacterium]|nr:SIS domain-containing protein [Planctomycetota bacterium]MBL7146348.1 SIS domain-containing protein [Phycisphaerae bacterium]